MLSAAWQWASSFFETVAAVAMVLLAGTVVAGVVFWIFRRIMGVFGDPEEDEFFRDEPDEDPPHSDGKIPADRGSSI